MVKQHGLSPLTRKLLRDLRGGWKSFVAIWIIGTLAITLHIGINATWQGMQHNVDWQFEVGSMADLWVYSPTTDRTARNLAALPGVADAQRRVLVNGKATGLPGEPAMQLVMSDGPERMNLPLLTQGTGFPPGMKNACILQSTFAAHHGLAVGDALRVEASGQQMELTVSAIGDLAEFVVTMHNGEFSPSPASFGYALVSPGTLGFLPYTQTCLALEAGADAAAVKAAAQALLADQQAVVMMREDLGGIQMAMDEAQQLEAMGRIFPLVFFIIAALITWTTMSRLVENQRLQIGTLLSQGYGQRALTLHYASYGLVVGVGAVAAGFAAARWLIAPLLMDMIGTLYALPGSSPYLHLPTLLVVGGVLLGITGGASLLSAHTALRLTPATLLRPKPPGKGRRVPLERIGWLWRRLRFSSKMIQRNLTRNPVRLCMGIIGALGCTAMMLTGFGLRDSVDYVLRGHFTQTMRYDAHVFLEAGTDADYAQVVRLRSGASALEEEMSTSLEALLQGQWLVKPVFVQEDAHHMVVLHDESGADVTLPAQGIALTRKLYEEYALPPGSPVSLRLPGGRPVETFVAAIVDIQLNQGIYISRSAWRQLDLMPWRPTAIMLRGEAMTLNALEELDGVSRVRTIDAEREANSKVLDVLNLVVVLMVAFSGSLALVVLFNLGQLNFAERIRELATLMVLGFTPREIKRLVLRENLIIACIGMPLGLCAGPVLHRWVLESGLPDTLEFVPVIEPLSWVLTGAFTLLFALLVNWMLGRKFRQVNMVEALKSVE